MPVLQARRTVQLVADAGSQPAGLLVQRFPIALDGLAADVLAGYEYVSMAADRVEIRRGAEAGDVPIREAGDVLRRLRPAPSPRRVWQASAMPPMSSADSSRLVRDTMCPSPRASMNSTSLNRALPALTPGPIRRALPTMTPLCSCTTQGGAAGTRQGLDRPDRPRVRDRRPAILLDQRGTSSRQR